MGFRVVLIENEVKINLNLKNLVINKDDSEIWIPLDDISIIVIDNLNTHITTRMLSILAEENISLIICDKKHLPIGSFLTYENNVRASKMIKYQIDLNEEDKNKLWDEIVKSKICNQQETLNILLETVNEQYLNDYAKDIIDGDKFNREGTAAKVYFTFLMGNSFSRSNSDILLNSALDYGYSIVRSYIAKLIIAYGFNCQLGFHHKSEYNPFNLVDDVMEPIRPILDICAYRMMKNEKFFLPEHRRNLINFINHYIVYNGKNMYIGNMIEEYIIQIINAVKNKNTKIIFPKSSDYKGEISEI